MVIEKCQSWLSYLLIPKPNKQFQLPEIFLINEQVALIECPFCAGAPADAVAAEADRDERGFEPDLADQEPAAGRGEPAEPAHLAVLHQPAQSGGAAAPLGAAAAVSVVHAQEERRPG